MRPKARPIRSMFRLSCVVVYSVISLALARRWGCAQAVSSQLDW